MKNHPPFFTYFVLSCISFTMASQTGFSTGDLNEFLSLRTPASAAIPNLTLKSLPKFKIEVEKPKETSISPQEASYLTKTDLRKYGISFTFFKDNSAGVTGTLPEACANDLDVDMTTQNPINYSVDNSKNVHKLKDDDLTEADSFSDDGDNSASVKQSHHSKSISSEEDLNDRTVTIVVAPFYQGHGSYKTLAECIEGEKNSSAKTDLTSITRLRKNLLGESVLGEIKFKSNEIEAPFAATEAYKKSKKFLIKLDCEECAGKSRTVKDALSTQESLDKLGLHININKLLVNAVVDAVDKVDSANSLADLTRARKNLLALGKIILRQKGNKNTEDDDNESIGNLIDGLSSAFTEVEDRAKVLANQDPKNVIKYADFISETAKSVSKIRPKNKSFAEFQIEQKKLGDDFSKKGFARISFISNIDHQNPEAAEFLGSTANLLSAAMGDANVKCAAATANPNDSLKKQDCLTATQKVSSLNEQINPVAKNFFGPQYGTPDAQSNLAQTTGATPQTAPAQTAASIPPGYFLYGPNPSPNQFQSITSVFANPNSNLNGNKNLVPTPTSTNGYIPPAAQSVTTAPAGYAPPNS